MNKPRPSALPLKKSVRVSPPTAPGGFFSFSSFRVKKGQSNKGDAPSSSESSQNNRRRNYSGGDCEQSSSVNFFSAAVPDSTSSSSSSWAAAVVSPLATQKFFATNNSSSSSSGNGCRLSTFQKFNNAESAPSTPCTGQDYRFVKGKKHNQSWVIRQIPERGSKK